MPSPPVRPVAVDAYRGLTVRVPAEIKKILKPDVFQEFELQEKTVVSHNVAM